MQCGWGEEEGRRGDTCRWGHTAATASPGPVGKVQLLPAQTGQLESSVIVLKHHFGMVGS